MLASCSDRDVFHVVILVDLLQVSSPHHLLRPLKHLNRSVPSLLGVVIQLLDVV